MELGIWFASKAILVSYLIGAVGTLILIFKLLRRLFTSDGRETVDTRTPAQIKADERADERYDAFITRVSIDEVIEAENKKAAEKWDK